MGMDININKYTGIKCDTNEELQNYLNINGYENEEKICYWRRHYWVNDWFKTNSTHSCRDEFILTKEDIQNFYDYCKNLLEDKNRRNEIEDSVNFYCCLSNNYTKNDIIIEIAETIKQIEILLNEDFQTNCFVYDMSC